jgi:hypothetical protein
MTGLQVPAELDAPASAFVQPGEAEGSDPRMKAALENVVKKRRKGLNPLLLLAQPAAQAFDAYSTDRALKAGGVHEGNASMAPVAGNTAALYAAKVGLGIGTAIASQLVAKSGHRTLAKILGSIGVVEPTAMGVHNMQMAGQQQ